MMGWKSRVSSLVVLVAALGVIPHEARAQVGGADRAAAQALFDQGMKLMAANDYVGACPKLEESNRLDPATGTRFNLADCFSHIGKTATAWTLFLDVAAATKASGQADREKVARDRARAIEPKLAKLTIVAPSADKTPGLEVKRDDTGVSRALWGTPLPIDQGEHVITATAPGMQAWRGSVVVKGDGASVTATVPELQPIAPSAVVAPPVVPANAPATTLSPAPISAPTPMPPTDAKDTTSSDGGGSRRAAGIVIASVGVVGIGIGAAMGLVANSKNNDAKNDPSKCPSASACYPAGYDEVNSAKSAATVSTIAFTAGAVALVGGVVLYLTAPKGSSASALRIAPAVGAGTGGFVLGGRF